MNKPKEKDPNEGRSIFIHETNKATYEDGTPFIPFKTKHIPFIVITGYSEFKDFIDNAGEKVKERIIQRMTQH